MSTLEIDRIEDSGKDDNGTTNTEGPETVERQTEEIRSNVGPIVYEIKPEDLPHSSEQQPLGCGTSGSGWVPSGLR